MPGTRYWNRLSSGIAFERAQFLKGVDVAEGVRLVVELDLSYTQCCIPGVYLAPAVGEKPRQMRQHIAPAQAEHRVRLITGSGDRDLSLPCPQRGIESCHQIIWQERGVARHGRHQRMACRAQRALQPGERSR